MRFYGLASLVGAVVLGACGGGENKSMDSSAAAPPAAQGTDAMTPATGTVAKIPATGTTHTVNMVSDAQGYRFDPANITIKSGDAIKFVMVSGGPHDVAFDPADLPADVAAQLNANMDQKLSDLTGTMMMNANQEYIVSFGGIKPGTYTFHCTPHLAMNMKGTVTVQ